MVRIQPVTLRVAPFSAAHGMLLFLGVKLYEVLIETSSKYSTP